MTAKERKEMIARNNTAYAESLARVAAMTPEEIRAERERIHANLRAAGYAAVSFEEGTGLTAERVREIDAEIALERQMRDTPPAAHTIPEPPRPPASTVAEVVGG